MISPEKIRFLVETIEKLLLVVAIIKREYSLVLLIVVAGLIITKMYADIVDIKKKSFLKK